MQFFKCIQEIRLFKRSDFKCIQEISMACRTDKQDINIFQVHCSSAFKRSVFSSATRLSQSSFKTSCVADFFKDLICQDFVSLTLFKPVRNQETSSAFKRSDFSSATILSQSSFKTSWVTDFFKDLIFQDFVSLTLFKPRDSRHFVHIKSCKVCSAAHSHSPSSFSIAVFMSFKLLS